MENLENEIEVIEVKENKPKIKRVKWTLDMETLTLSLEGTTLYLEDTCYESLSKIDQYVFIYGIKQACSDSGAGIKDYEERKNAIVERFKLFINKDSDFLPQGRKKLTPEEKLALKAKKVNELVEQMVNGGMERNIAISIAEKTFK